jgi:putative hemolysin
MPRKKISEKEIVVSAAVPARHKPASTTRVKRSVPAPAPAAPVTQIAPAAPSQEDVANLAYSYWAARGCQGGSPEEDWLRAERELTASAIA